jgi:putative phosphoesterase
MTHVGLVSDTHLPRFGRALPRALVAGLRAANVSRILHCGDFTEPIAIELFEEIAPFDAVAGNNDPEPLWTRYGRRKIVTIEDVRIGLVHGDVGRGRSAHENAIAAFADQRVDVIAYGHSHRPVVDVRPDGRIVANPGSPTDKRMMPTFSYAILTVDGASASVAVTTYTSRDTGLDPDREISSRA